MYTIKHIGKFKKDYRRVEKQGFDMSKLHSIIACLVSSGRVPDFYQPHPLRGEWAGFMECHIESDWLLIYAVDTEVKLVSLTRTGSHAKLFNK